MSFTDRFRWWWQRHKPITWYERWDEANNALIHMAQDLEKLQQENEVLRECLAQVMQKKKDAP